MIDEPLKATEAELLRLTEVAEYIVAHRPEEEQNPVLAKVKREQEDLNSKFNDFREYLNTNDDSGDSSDSDPSFNVLSLASKK